MSPSSRRTDRERGTAQYAVWPALVTLAICVTAFFLLHVLPEALKRDSAGKKEAVEKKTGIARGQQIFAQTCFVCHGPEGRGGIANENYIGGTIPRLDIMASRMALDDASADKVVSTLGSGQGLKEPIDIPHFDFTRSVYRGIRQAIQGGRTAIKRDKKKDAPPLQMLPGGGNPLSEEEFDWVIGYLVGRKVKPEAPAGETFLARGKRLFRRNCALCHGQEGRGGIPNENYIKGTVPPLSKMADGAGGKSIKLFEKSDAGKVIAALATGKSLDELKRPLNVGSWNVVLAQYKNIREIIRKGNPAGKKDPKGPEPPLQMPAWQKDAGWSDADINAVLAYLLSVQEWEEEEDGGGYSGEEKPREERGTEVKVLKQGDPIPDAELVDQDGRKFKISSLRGSVLVVAFLYTNCNVATMCPMAAQRLVEAQGELKKAGAKGVRFLVVTFDPKRDTPQALKKFAARYGADPAWFRFAGGRPEEIGPLAAAFHNHYRQVSPGVFDHTIVVSLVDRKGILRDDFFGTGWETAEFVSAVRRLLD